MAEYATFGLLVFALFSAVIVFPAVEKGKDYGFFNFKLRILLEDKTF